MGTELTHLVQSRPTPPKRFQIMTALSPKSQEENGRCAIRVPAARDLRSIGGAVSTVINRFGFTDRKASTKICRTSRRKGSNFSVPCARTVHDCRSLDSSASDMVNDRSNGCRLRCFCANSSPCRRTAPLGMKKVCYAGARRCSSEVEVSVVLRSRGTVWTQTPAVNPLLLP